MSTDKPSPGQLWHEAGGDGDRYRDLMHQHGMLLKPGDEGYDQASRTLSCGWEPGKNRAEQDRCDITDLLRASCSHCTGRGEPVPEEHDKASLGHVFTARYAAPCGWCGERFQAGERVRGDQVNGGYVCETCWS